LQPATKFERSTIMSEVNVKKAYAAIYALLEANKAKKVSTILPQLVELMSKATTAVETTTRFDEDGKLTHVYCYYHKEWEDVAEVEFGKKANTKSGLNTMCKLGVSNWSKQQRAKKKAEAELLTQLTAGTITVEDLPTLQAKILDASKAIVARPVEAEAE